MTSDSKAWALTTMAHSLAPHRHDTGAGIISLVDRRRIWGSKERHNLVALM